MPKNFLCAAHNPLRNRTHRRPSSLLILILVVISGCANSGVVNKTQLLLGTTVEISVADANIDRDAKIAAIDKAFKRVKEIDSFMSSYKKDSEVSKINNFADIRPVVVNVDTIKVIKRADEINRITDGAFDITVAPLGQLWGFDPSGANLKTPSEEDIKKALELTGMDKLKIDYAKRTISFKYSGMKIDLGGIATGYAVDCAIGTLKENGIKNAMVNAGGDIYCMGRGPYNRIWKVGIQHPRSKNNLLAVVGIENKAIATSGDYEKFFFWKEKRISHIIDPITGMPVTDIPASVTIIAPNCMTADALSTGVFVLGPDRGMKVLNKIKSVEAMIAVADGQNIKLYKTDGFKKL